MTLTKIISGGQTGADQGALHGARFAGLETGGAAPMGYWTENGGEPALLGGYGLVETFAWGYSSRTRINVMNSDGTLIFGDPESRGSDLTRRICLELDKPYQIVRWPFRGPQDPSQNSYNRLSISTVKQWLNLHNIETLNVAGNRESVNPGIHDATSSFVVNLVKELRKETVEDGQNR